MLILDVSKIAGLGIWQEGEKDRVADSNHNIMYLLHLEERFRVDDLGWDATNEFWQDPDSGYVWQSVQYTAPTMPPITLDVVTPYGGS